MKKEIILGFIKKNSPTLLTVVGVAGMFGMTVLAVKSTPKAADVLNEYKTGEKKSEDKVMLLKQMAPLYLPSLLLGMSSAFCIFYGHSLEVKRTAALLTLYQLSESARGEYRNKVIETIGEKKESEVVRKIAEDKAKKLSDEEVKIYSQVDMMWFYDASFGRFFPAKSQAEVDNNAVRINKMIQNNGSANVQDFWDLNNVKGDTTEGEKLGWHDQMDDVLELRWLPGYIDTPWGAPAKAFTYTISPIYEYDY